MTETERAAEIASQMRIDLFDKHGITASRLWAKEGAISDMNAMMVAILSQARSQAYEESAKIAENYRTNMAFWMGLDLETARQATEIAGHDISNAIRSKANQ